MGEGSIKATKRIALLATLLAFLVLPATASAEFSIAEFSASTTSSQAGAHPDVTTSVVFPTIAGDGGTVFGDGNVRTLVVQLPPGLQGASGAIAGCSQFEFTERRCGAETQVGWVEVALSDSAGIPSLVRLPVFNLQPGSDEVAAEIGFAIGGLVTTHLPIEVRSNGDYGLSVIGIGISRLFSANAFSLTMWGVPGDPSHDPQRLDMETHEPVSPGPLPRIPFLTNPTSCGEDLALRAEATSYQEPEKVIAAQTTLPPITGCSEVEFAPRLRARPTTDVADSPSGLDLDLAVPQNLDPDGLASAQPREATLTLPEGLVVNPSAANGLEACSPDQIGLKSAVGDPLAHFGLEPPSCPAASSLGDVEIVTPLLGEPLKGSVYLATAHQNPFGSLLALYLSIQGPGLDIKLPGKVEPDPQTGRITITFENTPQLSMEHLRIHLFKGASALLRTPAVCGAYATTSSLTPWSAPQSGPPATPKDEYAIVRAPGGESCAHSESALPSSPSFEAGSIAPIAGRSLPFVVNLSREDGTQQFGALTVTPPPGLLAKLAGVDTCPDLALALAVDRSGEDEESSPSCPAGSKVGRVVVDAGAGPKPYTVSGTAYLAGPYKGAPFSLAVVTAAVAGPFDLGTVVVRVALYFDPETAQVTARSDPIPSILEGIPLDVRSLSIRLDRPNFIRTPTSCDPMKVSGSLTSLLAQSASLNDPYQVGECRRLWFKPQVTLSLSGPTHRSAHPALRAVVKMPKKGASIAAATLTLPETEFLENSHLRGVCSKPRYAARGCPSRSVVGYAKAWTPLLDQPLRGPVYLRASHHLLPDLVASLEGPIHIDLAGRLDFPEGRIRATFGAVPDAPLSKLVLSLRGGGKGLLVNNSQLCKSKPRASTVFAGHNGKISRSNPRVKVGCGRDRR
jgi:hypothetical protein